MNYAIDVGSVCRLLVEDPGSWYIVEEAGGGRSLAHPYVGGISFVQGIPHVRGFRLGLIGRFRLGLAYRKRQRILTEQYLERKRRADLDAAEREADRLLTEDSTRLHSPHETDAWLALDGNGGVRSP